MRELSESQAHLLSALVELADATAADEVPTSRIAAALTCTHREAAARLNFAVDVVRRLPAVHAALAAGHIDLDKASVLRDAVATVDLSLARSIVAEVLPDAGTVNIDQLRARLAAVLVKADLAAGVPAAVLRRIATANSLAGQA